MSSSDSRTQTNTSGANNSSSGGQRGSSEGASGWVSRGASGGSERRHDDRTYHVFETVDQVMEHERKKRDKREEERRQMSNGNADD